MSIKEKSFTPECRYYTISTEYDPVLSTEHGDRPLLITKVLKILDQFISVIIFNYLNVNLFKFFSLSKFYLVED